MVSRLTVCAAAGAGRRRLSAILVPAGEGDAPVMSDRATVRLLRPRHGRGSAVDPGHARLRGVT